MIRTAVPVSLALLVFALSGCDRADTPPTSATADAETVAIVNGIPITRAALFAHAGFDAGREFAGADGALDELINLELLRQQAVAQGIDQEPDVRMLLRNIESNLLASQVIERAVGSMRFPESEIEAEYNRQIEAFERTEYRARHILVESEAEATDLITALDAGGDFSRLAETHSIDGSAERGGDLGWFSAGQMIAPFSAAVAALEPGGYTREPVETRFGWHVIHLDETRDNPPPALDEVRHQVEEILQSRALRSFLEELRAGARIEFPERPAQ